METGTDSDDDEWICYDSNPNFKSDTNQLIIWQRSAKIFFSIDISFIYKKENIYD